MKYIIIVLVFTLQLFAGVVQSPLVSVDKERNIATIEIDKIDIGMSGFIVHTIAKGHSAILKNILVVDYDAQTKIATLEMSPFDGLKNNALPTGKWSVETGDMAVLAFGYTRGVLIAPSDEIYYRVTRNVKNLQWIHPDIFATILSFNGHPTPLREDFTKFAIATSVGLVFIYLDGIIFTVDSKSFKILNTIDSKLKQKNTELPFYKRVEEIDAGWWGLWGEGTSELEAYEPHYYKLLSEANPDNKELEILIENFNKKVSK